MGMNLYNRLALDRVVTQLPARALRDNSRFHNTKNFELGIKPAKVLASEAVHMMYPSQTMPNFSLCFVRTCSTANSEVTLTLVILIAIRINIITRHAQLITTVLSSD